MKNSLISFLALCSAQFCFGQGSLTPPGPPAPTMKTLSQVEPRNAITNTGAVVISEPGSYYLTTNLSVSSGDGVFIGTNRVTLDLNGFTIFSSSDARSGVGININGGGSDITIFNGHVTGGVTNNAGVYNGPGFADGIAYSGVFARNVRVFGVTVSGCRNSGILLGIAPSTLVESCVVHDVGGSGIEASTVSDCTAWQCYSGINAETAHNCYAYAVGGYGISAVNANNCYGAATIGSATGLAASSALNCYGLSATGNGLVATLAQNCYGITGGSGVGLNVSMAQNCYGRSSNGYGIYSNLANSCQGATTTGTGLYAGYAAFLCFGSGTVSGVTTYIANSCYGAPNASATFRYNMP